MIGVTSVMVLVILPGRAINLTNRLATTAIILDTSLVIAPNLIPGEAFLRGVTTATRPVTGLVTALMVRVVIFTGKQVMVNVTTWTKMIEVPYKSPHL